MSTNELTTKVRELKEFVITPEAKQEALEDLDKQLWISS